MVTYSLCCHWDLLSCSETELQSISSFCIVVTVKLLFIEGKCFQQVESYATRFLALITDKCQAFSPTFV